jgi:hypothetical protein
MSLTYVGEISLGVLTPVSLTCAGSLAGSLSADLALLADLVVGIGIYPPDLTANVTALVSLALSLTAGISIGLTPPSINFILDDMASLEASLVAPLAFSLLLGGGAGIYSYAYSGTGKDFGPAVTEQLASGWPDGTLPSANVNAIVLATVTPSVWTTVLGFFGSVPPLLPAGVTLLGQYNIGTLCPVCVDATAGIIANLNARLAGMLAISISPPSVLLTDQLATALALKSAIVAALALHLPGASFSAAAAAALVAKVNAQLSALLAFQALLTGAGVMVFSYSGPGSGLGPALTSTVGGGWPDGSPFSVDANALMLGVTSSPIWATVSAFFGGA